MPADTFINTLFILHKYICELLTILTMPLQIISTGVLSGSAGKHTCHPSLTPRNNVKEEEPASQSCSLTLPDVHTHAQTSHRHTHTHK